MDTPGGWWFESTLSREIINLLVMRPDRLRLVGGPAFKTQSMNQRNPTPIPSIQTWYVTFDFGTRHIIGPDEMNLSGRWVEVKGRTRQSVHDRIVERFGLYGWQLHSEEAFTPDRRKFYPNQCCLILHAES